MRDYDKLLEAGTNAQMEKLMENTHKSDFEDLSISYLLDRVLDEYIELREAVKTTGIPTLTHLSLIRREAADVANFAHMIVYQCDKGRKENS